MSRTRGLLRGTPADRDGRKVLRHEVVPLIRAMADPGGTTLCVVESIRDIVAIESTQTYHGVYHVLGGLISPMQGIGPEDLTFSSLFNRIKSDEVKEVIMALNPNMEGDTTTFYISRQLDLESISLTSLSRGISFGGELEFADAMTLSRSLAARQPFDRYLSR